MKIRALFILLILSKVTLSQSHKNHIDKKLVPAIEELKEFVALPNDAIHSEDILRNIEWLTQKFEERGFTTKVLKTEGQPLFFAEINSNKKKKTILFYMHLDGQAVEVDKWDQKDPYTIELKKEENGSFTSLPWLELNSTIDENWRLFGRSTADDKGPIVMLLQAIDLLKEEKKKLPFNIKVILDSEEEKSSEPLPGAVKKYRDILQADYLVINDGPTHSSGKPTLVFGCRGITTVTLTTYGPVRPQHSGHYGNYAPNPGFRLAHLLSSLKDEQGRVLIKGYYDGIDIPESYQKILESVPDHRDSILKNLGIHSPEKVGDYYQESLQYPSLNIRGMSSGWTGDQTRTIVPATATAEIDMRLVPESDGERLKGLLRQHIQGQGYYITDVEPTIDERMSYDKILKFESSSVTQSFRTDLDIPFANWLEKAIQKGEEESIVKIRIMGGTVPIAAFINELKIPAIIVPLVNPDNNQHSPNENLKIKNIKYGIRTFYHILSTPLN